MQFQTITRKTLNIFELGEYIERKGLPEWLSNPKIPSVQKIISSVKEFNRILTNGEPEENPTPGSFRVGPVEIKNTDHTPPPHLDIPHHMEDFADTVIRMWGDDRVKLHAYVLWRINWIHPFYNGNGRTSRDFSYFLLCVQFGGTLPGNPDITAQIQKNKEDHYQALHSADDNNLIPLENQTRKYLKNQLDQALM